MSIPLIAATSQGHLKIIHLLLEAGADPNQHRNTAQLDQQRAAYLVKDDEASSSDGGNQQWLAKERFEAAPIYALAAACITGSKSVFEELLYAGAVVVPSVEDQDLMRLLCESAPSPTTLEMIDLLLDAADGRDQFDSLCEQGLLKSAAQGNKALFERLLTYVEGDTSTMMLACQCGLLQAVQMLHSLGVALDRSDETGRRPLSIAAHHFHLDIVEFLFTQGAGVAVADGIHVPLLDKALAGCKNAILLPEAVALPKLDVCEAMVKYLIEKGSRVTPETVRQAAAFGRAEIVSLLLDLIDPPSHSAEWMTPALFEALDENHPSVVRVLLQRGADPNAIRETPTPEDNPAGCPGCYGKTWFRAVPRVPQVCSITYSNHPGLRHGL
nr:ankyrin repeat protein [Colletotrichum truncatum]KAF6783027.1 ankyrin repeat protein [Colletotrichum truncatum]